MVNERQVDEEAEPLTNQIADFSDSTSVASSSEASISLALLDRIVGSSHGDNNASTPRAPKRADGEDFDDKEKDLEDGGYLPPGGRPIQKQVRIICWILGMLCVIGWALAFLLLLTRWGRGREGSSAPTPDLSNIPLTGHAG